MKTDENSDSAFALVFCSFLACLNAPMTLGILISMCRSGFRDKDGKLRKCFLYCILINILVWFLIYYIAATVAEEDWMKDFDPYVTLGVSKGDSIGKIRKSYRKLSQKWHPDKNPDPSASKMFHLINKAKDILTDPEKKDNFLKYGHEDGLKGGFKMGIALPTFLFNENYQLLILGTFAFFLLIVLPCWVFGFFNADPGNKDPETGVRLENVEMYLKESSRKLKYEQIVPIFAKSFEYIDFWKFNSKEEVNELNVLLNQIPKKVKDQHKGTLYMKNIVLIYSHIMNLQMVDKNLKKWFDEMRKLVPNQVEFCIGSLISVTLYEIQRNGASGIPLKNVHMLIDFTKKYLNRVYTDNCLELFTEEIDLDTIELLQKKGHSIYSLAEEKKRKQVLEELKIDENETDIINQYYQGLPIFTIQSTKAYVEGHDNIEEGDFVRIKVKITLENSEEPSVVDNIFRKSFNYSGEHNKIPKIPYLYLFMTDKSGNLQGFDKIPFTKFINQEENTVIKSVIHTSVVSFGVEGDKKINIRVMNDSFLTETKGLDKTIVIKVLPKSEPIEEIGDDDQESIDGSEGDSRVDDSDEEVETDKKND